MTIKRKKNVFIVWIEYQRRVEVLAPILNLEVHYFFYPWESKSKVSKLWAYFLKTIHTLKVLFQNDPEVVFVQFPPAPALYCVALYSRLTGSKYVTDCHVGITNADWFDWIYVKKLLAGGQMIIHNDYLVEQVKASMNPNPFVVRDGIAQKQAIVTGKSTLLDRLGLSPKKYVIYPCSFSADEPLQEVLDAARLLPTIKFVMTWYLEKFPPKLRENLPSNVLLTDFLQIGDFNHLFANSGVALVLTKFEAVQLSGVQEAMAFEIPVVVSDLKTTRALYKDCPVFVKNDFESIANGVSYAFQNRPELETRVKKLRMESETEFFDQSQPHCHG